MAKPLRDPQPSSAMVRLFDGSAAARAIGRPSVMPLPSTATSPMPDPQPVAPARPPAFPHAGTALTGEPANIKRELVFSPSTDEALTRLIDLFKRVTKTRLKDSHVARAVFKAVESCMEEIEHEASSIGPLKLPSNARGREGDREQFEEKLAEAITNGIRKSAAYISKK